MSDMERLSSDARRDLASRVRQCSIEDFYAQMVEQDVRRAYVLYENGEFTISHPLLEPIQAFFEFSRDFSRHEAVFIARGDAFSGEDEDKVEVPLFAFVHNTQRGLAQGGLRFIPYTSLADVLLDGLRLAQGMTRKNALAGLWWGGGKGIMPLPPRTHVPADPEDPARQRYFKAYGRFIASLGGVYYTAEDMGTGKKDMAAVLSQNRFTTCIPEEYGGSGNPSPYTARGVRRGMQAAWRMLTGSDSMRGVRVAVQGVGNVGSTLARELHELGAHLWLADVPAARQRLEQLAEELGENVHVVADPDSVYDLEVDVLSPCAGGGTINQETIPRLRARLVCGAANNILREPSTDAEHLRNRNIDFVPDFICNRMGIINCANEWMGYLAEDTYLAVAGVYPDTLRVFKHARNLLTTTTAAANQLADIAANELHPMIGHRGRRIIDHLIDVDWAETIKSKGRSSRKKAGRKQLFDPALDEEPVRRRWETGLRFRGTSPSLATAPIRADESPNLDSFLLPTLLDIRARALESFSGRCARRILGTDHGGLNLQLAVERSLPYDRDEVGRPQFLELCQDFYRQNEAAIREQLHQLGIGFDAQAWLDPMNRTGQEVVRRLFHALNGMGLVSREDYFSYHCLHCCTVLVSKDVTRTPSTTERFKISFPLGDGDVIQASCFLPELLLGAVAVAVSSDGPYGNFAGQYCRNPLNGKLLPVVTAALAGEAAAIFLAPAHSRVDAEIAQAHGIAERPRIFDETVRICVDGYRGHGIDEVRTLVIKRLGTHLEHVNASWNGGADGWKVERCGKCKSIAVEGTSQQFFVNFRPVVGYLQRLVESEEVSYPNSQWREHTLKSLNVMRSWCISRQNWWGNPLPTAPNMEVLSPWFSMAALTLHGAGWPEAPEPELIDEVFVNPALLERWVIPSQLVALALTGRPLFRQVNVYGSLHVREFERAARADLGAAESVFDEERLTVKTVLRPMRGDAGNIIQPKTLVRRFGADALRLGYLLCLGAGHQETLTLSEAQLRRARKALRALTAKLTGILNIKPGPEQDDCLHLLDGWLLAYCDAVRGEVRAMYEERRLYDSAEMLLKSIKQVIRYSDLVAARPRDEGGLSRSVETVRATLAAAVEALRQVFSPICPYIFEVLAERTKAGVTAERVPQPEPWLHLLVEELAARGGDVELLTPDPVLLQRLRRDCGELGQLTRARITPTDRPSPGEAIDLGRCLLVRPGALKLPPTSSDLLRWYRSSVS